MAKSKAPSVPNKFSYSRASYLYQAAHYLANPPQISQDDSAQTISSKDKHSAPNPSAVERQAALDVSRYLSTDLRAVCLKAQIRQSPAMKRGICKFCDTVQVEGKTCHLTVENSSKGGKKSWVDVLAIRCLACGHVKRFPVSASRQKRRHLREGPPQLTEESAVKSEGKEEDPGT